MILKEKYIYIVPGTMDIYIVPGCLIQSKHNKL